MESRTLRRGSLLLAALLTVIFVPFANGVPSRQPIDVLTGFINEDGDVMGRPVGVSIDAQGALLVADDVGNTIWRVSRAQGERERGGRAHVAPSGRR